MTIFTAAGRVGHVRHTQMKNGTQGRQPAINIAHATYVARTNPINARSAIRWMLPAYT